MWRILCVVQLMSLKLSVEGSGACIPLDDMCSCRYDDTQELITLWDIDNPNEVK